MKLKKKKALVFAAGALMGTGLGITVYAVGYKKGWIDDPSQDADADNKNYNCTYEDHDHFLAEGSLG